MASQMHGGSEEVKATRCLVWAGIKTQSPDSRSAFLKSSYSRTALPWRSTTHSSTSCSSQVPWGVDCPAETILSIFTGDPGISDSNISSSGSTSGMEKRFLECLKDSLPFQVLCLTLLIIGANLRSGKGKDLLFERTVVKMLRQIQQDRNILSG